MNLQDQVCTLEQAKKLNELGVDRVCLFWWSQETTPSNPNLYHYGWTQDQMPWEIHYSARHLLSGSTMFAYHQAYTVSELVNMLPATIDTGASLKEVHLLIQRADDIWLVMYVDASETASYVKEGSKNLAAAIAAIIIRLYKLNHKL